jgi:hypothetical protein
MNKLTGMMCRNFQNSHKFSISPLPLQLEDLHSTCSFKTTKGIVWLEVCYLLALFDCNNGHKY